jgi:hypothetical protein
MVFRFGKETPLGSKPKIRRLVKPGSQFQERLEELYKSGLNRTKLTRLTGMGSQLISTILRARGYTVGGLTWKPYQGTLEHKLHTDKGKVLKWLRDNPKGTRSQLNRALAGALARLRRSDPAWYEQHAPRTAAKRGQMHPGQRQDPIN